MIVQAEKHYGEPPCAHVVVDELTLDDDRAAPEDERCTSGAGAGPMLRE